MGREQLLEQDFPAGRLNGKCVGKRRRQSPGGFD
jgi:hypothetical protein